MRRPGVQPPLVDRAEWSSVRSTGHNQDEAVRSAQPEYATQERTEDGPEVRRAGDGRIDEGDGQ